MVLWDGFQVTTGSHLNHSCIELKLGLGFDNLPVVKSLTCFSAASILFQELAYPKRKLFLFSAKLLFHLFLLYRCLLPVSDFCSENPNMTRLIFWFVIDRRYFWLSIEDNNNNFLYYKIQLTFCVWLYYKSTSLS